MFQNKFKYVAATFSMIFGSLFVFASVFLINRLIETPSQKVEATSSVIAMQKQIKPKPKQKVKKQKPKAKRERIDPPAAIDGLDSILSGIDFGLPGITNDMDYANSGILGNSNASIMTEDSVDVPPQPRSRRGFVYPRSAKKKGITGYVVMSLLIDRKGGVEKVKVVESSPQGLFETAAVDGIKSWQFEPAQYQGDAVKVWVKQKIRFDLG